MKKNLLLLLCFACAMNVMTAQTKSARIESDTTVVVGAARLDLFVPSLKGKHVAIVANQTSLVSKTHLVDTLLRMGVVVDRIFCPEHGFRGGVEAGAKVESTIDPKTKLPVVSLYGNSKKPTPEQLKNIDVVLFDLQDVGVRFYTYISTLHYVMEACAENNKPLVVLDRPNPNGYFVDGPVLKPDCKSFVGLHPVPIVYGMTIGEYAQMVNGEKWLANGVSCQLSVIPIKNYSHLTRYVLPVAPSPNLQSMQSVYLYPSLCLFEGTPISVGRGTARPFEVVGHPKLKKMDFTFTPKAIPGKSEKPVCNGELCFGYDLGEFAREFLGKSNSVNIFWIIDLYNAYPDKKTFFTPFFNKLAGDKSLQEMIVAGKKDQEIRESWKPAINQFKVIRKRYLIYPDFE